LSGSPNIDTKKNDHRLREGQRQRLFLTPLGRDVEIRVKRTRKAHGQMSLVVAA
jgi:hypothetical protein